MRIVTKPRGFSLICLLIAASATGARQTSTTAPKKLETISLCELTTNWRKYDHKMVRVDGIYSTGAESSEIYDPGCSVRDHVAWVPPDLAKMAPHEMIDKMSQLLESTGRAQIVAIGEFDGPKKVDIPPGTSPGLAATLQAADSHYGHQNGWDFQFVISTIEKVEPARADAPWPHWATEKKQ
jgi:hypothetical protein